MLLVLRGTPAASSLSNFIKVTLTWPALPQIMLQSMSAFVRTATEQSDDDTADAEHFDRTAIGSKAGAFLTNPEPCKINGHGPTSESA